MSVDRFRVVAAVHGVRPRGLRFAPVFDELRSDLAGGSIVADRW